jgi:hypothetical protein
MNMRGMKCRSIRPFNGADTDLIPIGKFYINISVITYRQIRNKEQT